MAISYIEKFQFCPYCGGAIELVLLKPREPERHVCQKCKEVHFLGPKLAAGVILVHDDQLVLTRRDIEPGRGLWTYPGGFVEIGEPVQDAAKREAREEVLAETQIDGILGIYSTPARMISVVVYRGRSVGAEPQAGDEVQEVGFFDLDKIPWEELAFSSVVDALKDYIAWTSS